MAPLKSRYPEAQILEVAHFEEIKAACKVCIQNGCAPDSST